MLTKKEYIKKGKCIWCLNEKPIVSFFTKPHTISKSLGSTNIGFDICDQCNKYFGSDNKQNQFSFSIEKAFKEIMNITRFMLKPNKTKDSWKELNSQYFNYYHSKQILKIKNFFLSNSHFLKFFTRQFKRGVYYIFLQEYHRCTENGLDERFNSIRDFARNDIGDLPLYFLVNNGVYLVEENIDSPSFSFNEKVITDINDFGFYQMWLFGNIFFLEVTPRSKFSKEIYLNKESQKLIGTGFVYRELRKMKYITDIDFTLRKLHNQ